MSCKTSSFGKILMKFHINSTHLMLSVAVLVAKRQKEGRCSQLSSSYLLLRVQFRFLQSQILVIDRQATVIGLLD